MKFTLTYDGQLSSSGNKSNKVEEKWSIRKHLDPQLKELWKINRALQLAKRYSVVPKTGSFTIFDTHHSDIAVVPPKVPSEGEIDLCAVIEKGGRTFFPLVRESYALVCALKILFLRRETVGRIYQGGDLDNRIKTLLDALCVPPDPALVKQDGSEIDDPIYCLLEDDSRITALDVQTERLLSRPESSEKEVRLVIEVDVRVAEMHVYNAQFLGD